MIFAKGRFLASKKMTSRFDDIPMITESCLTTLLGKASCTHFGCCFRSENVFRRFLKILTLLAGFLKY